MSTEALLCRKLGHNWQQKSMTRRRYHELISMGMMEDNMYCGNGCGWTWEMAYRLDDPGTLIVNKRKPPRDASSYLMPAGTGRLSRGEARLAYVARLAA